MLACSQVPQPSLGSRLCSEACGNYLAREDTGRQACYFACRRYGPPMVQSYHLAIYDRIAAIGIRNLSSLTLTFLSFCGSKLHTCKILRTLIDWRRLLQFGLCTCVSLALISKAPFHQSSYGTQFSPRTAQTLFLPFSLWLVSSWLLPECCPLPWDTLTFQWPR